MRNVVAATSTSVSGCAPAPASISSSATPATAADAPCRSSPGTQHAPLMPRAYACRPYDLRAMPEHVHVHAPHELGEVHPTTSPRERWLEVAAALMLSLAT